MFGFSKGIVFACATRFLLGVSNGNNPLVKTYIREISDDSNQVGGAVLWVGVVGEDATEGKGGGGKPRLLTCLQRRHRRNLPDPFSPNPSQTRMFSIRSLCYSLGRALGPLVRLSCLGGFFFVQMLAAPAIDKVVLCLAPSCPRWSRPGPVGHCCNVWPNLNFLLCRCCAAFLVFSLRSDWRHARTSGSHVSQHL